MLPLLFSCTQTGFLLTAYSIKACAYLLPEKKFQKERPSITMNGPKNLDFYLEAEKMFFMSSVQYAIVILEIGSKGKSAVYQHTATDNISPLFCIPISSFREICKWPLYFIQIGNNIIILGKVKLIFIFSLWKAWLNNGIRNGFIVLNFCKPMQKNVHNFFHFLNFL